MKTESDFDKVFKDLEAPDYPATCNECGLEATNTEMEEHVCAPAVAAPDHADSPLELLKLFVAMDNCNYDLEAMRHSCEAEATEVDETCGYCTQCGYRITTGEGDDDES